MNKYDFDLITDVSKLALKFMLIFGMLVTIPAWAEEVDAGLILTNSSLGALALGEGATVSEKQLRSIFPELSVTYDIGQGDSPDFHYFEVKNQKGETLFTIKSFFDWAAESKKTSAAVTIHLLQVYSLKIKDFYGLRIGDRVKDIIVKRKETLSFGAGHHDVYLGSNKIFYNIATGSEWSPERLSMEDAIKGNWPIRSISWPKPAWE